MFTQSKRTLTILVTAVALVWGALSLPAPGKGPPRGGGGGKTKEEDTTPPAAVNTLVVLSVTSSSVELGWFAVADDTGDPAAYYDIRYSTTPILTDEDFDNANLVHCDPVPEAPGTVESVTVGDLSAETTYDFALRVADAAGNWSAVSNVVFDMTDVTPSGEWELEVVDPLASQNLFSSLVLAYDPLTGGATIAYNYTYLIPDTYTRIHPMQLARWDGDGWGIELIEDPAGGDTSGVDLAYDPTGKATVSYGFRSHGRKFTTSLNFARRIGSNDWSTEIIDSSPGNFNYTSLAYGNNNNPLNLENPPSPKPSISYRLWPYKNQKNPGLKFAFWDGSSWVIEVVDACRRCGDGNSLAYDAYGTAYISYTANGDDGVFNARVVKLARRIGPNDWTIEIVTSCVAASPTSLKIDPNDNPSVGYSDFVNEKLKFARIVP